MQNPGKTAFAIISVFIFLSSLEGFVLKKKNGDFINIQDDYQPKSDYTVKIKDDNLPKTYGAIKTPVDNQAKTNNSTKIHYNQPNTDDPTKIQDNNPPEMNYATKIQHNYQPNIDDGTKIQDNNQPNTDVATKIQEDNRLKSVDAINIKDEDIPKIDELQDKLGEHLLGFSEKSHRFKREEPKKTYTKVVLESVRDGTGIFAATQGAITAVVPNPVTAVAAGLSGVVSAVTAVIASNIT